MRGDGLAYYDVYSSSITLEEALEDSPMFRKKIKNAESSVDDFASGIKKILKACKHIQAAARDYEVCFKDFISEVVAFKNTMGMQDEILDKGFLRMTNGLQEIVQFQNLLAQQMEGHISSPLHDFVNNDLKVVREQTKRYEKSNAHLDSVLVKLGQVKKKNSQKVEELEQELSSARRAHTSICLDTTLIMNEALAKKKFEFLEHIEGYMHAQMTYFHQGHEYFKDLEPHMKNYSKHLASTRRYFEEEKKKSWQRRATLEANPVRSPTLQATSQIEKRGYLFKRSAGDVIDTWSKRYFVLQDNQLCGYKTKEQQPDIVLQLLLYTVKTREDLDRRNCFELVSPPDKSLLLQAENEESKQEWIQAIQLCISNLLNAQPSLDEKHSRKDTSKAVPLLDDTSSPTAELRQLSPGCADCDAKDPEWASINLGILLCIECSGIHRSMGVHISKVRSLTLDAWEPDLLEMMAKLGNTKVNSIFEEDVPADRQKPTPTASWDVRQKWIRDKYENKKFVKPSYIFPVEMHKQMTEAIAADNVLQVLRLYAQGIDLNYQDPANSKQTALHLAVKANKPSVIILLIMNAADPTLKDDQGWTPVHTAADRGFAQCAIPLLQKNTVHILSIVDKNNRTPLDIAISNGGADCVTLFRLALLAKEEVGVSYEESFAQALRMFSKDARTKS